MTHNYFVPIFVPLRFEVWQEKMSKCSCSCNLSNQFCVELRQNVVSGAPKKLSWSATEIGQMMVCSMSPTPVGWCPAQQWCPAVVSSFGGSGHCHTITIQAWLICHPHAVKLSYVWKSYYKVRLLVEAAIAIQYKPGWFVTHMLWSLAMCENRTTVKSDYFGVTEWQCCMR